MSTLHKLYQETHTTIENVIRGDHLRAGVTIEEPHIVNIASQLILFEFEMAAVEVAATELQSKNKNHLKFFASNLLGASIAGAAIYGVSGLVVGAIAGGMLGAAATDIFGCDYIGDTKKEIAKNMASQGIRPPYKFDAKEMPETYALALQSLACDAQFVDRMRQRVAQAHHHYDYS